LGFVKNSFLKWCLYRLEAWVYRGAHSIVALSPTIKEDIEKRTQANNVFLLTNMADTSYYSPERKRPELEAQFGVAGKFVISYIGAVGFANGLDFMIDCARAAKKAGLPVHFLLCGDGALLENLKTATARHALNNLDFVPFQTREGVREIMNVTDATLVCYRPVPVLETGSPNKYFDGLAAGKLIVVNFSGWIRQEVEARRCGVYVSANNPESFVHTITPFLNNASALLTYQENSRALAEEKYNRTLLSGTFVGMVKLPA
jgi:glycosyltransferase involved in cell wall biosynthesis